MSGVAIRAAAIVGVRAFLRRARLGRITRKDCVRVGFNAGFVVSISSLMTALVWNINKISLMELPALIFLSVAASVFYGICGAVAGHVFALFLGIRLADTLPRSEDKA